MSIEINRIQEQAKAEIQRQLMVIPEVQTERLNICNACPFFQKKSNACGKCGCNMPKKTKLKRFKCPEGKF